MTPVQEMVIEEEKKEDNISVNSQKQAMEHPSTFKKMQDGKKLLTISELSSHSEESKKEI